MADENLYSIWPIHVIHATRPTLARYADIFSDSPNSKRSLRWPHFLSVTNCFSSDLHTHSCHAHLAAVRLLRFQHFLSKLLLLAKDNV